MDTNAKVYISASEGILEISGPDKFVSETFKVFEEEAKAILKNVSAKKKPDAKPTGAGSGENGRGAGQDADNILSGIAELDADQNVILTIDPKPHWTSTSSQARNTCIIYLFAVYTLKPTEQVTAAILRDICTTAGCYDSKNFGTHIKDLAPNASISGSGDNRKVTLTNPGKSEAKKLISEIRKHDEK